MNTQNALLRSSALMLASLSLLGLPGLLSAAAPKEPVYENYIDIASGYTLQSGDRANFQKALQVNKKGYGGIEDLFITQSLNDTTTLTLRGHALAGNEDYLLDLALTKDEVGYLKFGYKSFRTWYDGSGGYFPRTGSLISLYDESLYVDRGNLWLEAASTRENALNVLFRYDLLTREGTKDSTSWFDTGLPLGSAQTRYIVPTYLKFDEKRHILSATVSSDQEKTDWSLGLRYDKGDYSNGKYARRRPFETGQDRYVTSKEGQDYDLFQIRGSYLTQITEQIKLTTAVARTKIDTILSGSRVVGMGYDADYSSTYANRQQRDEGFFGLLPGNQLGESQMTQSIATLNALYAPTETLRITPGFRFEKTEWNNRIDFEETNFGGAPSFAPINDEVEADSEKAWKTYAASLDTRYTGFKNLSLNFKADWSKSDGELQEERILEPGTPLQVISIDRDTEMERAVQKYALTANWYLRPGATLAVQYYHKARQNDYRAVRDNTISTSDRYPAYVANQDLETDDFNIRVSWRFSPTLRTVTRYDYQKNTIKSQDVGLAPAPSMISKQHILSESITWQPKPRWYLQGSVNYVYDTLMTPAVTLTGLAGGLVKNSDANYLNFTASSGYAIDEASDVLVDYSLYEALGNYVDNSALTVPYGTDSQTQMASIGWVRRLDRRTTLTLKYTYAKNEDAATGYTANYEANLFYAKLQYRF